MLVIFIPLSADSFINAQLSNYYVSQDKEFSCSDHVNTGQIMGVCHIMQFFVRQSPLKVQPQWVYEVKKS